MALLSAGAYAWVTPPQIDAEGRTIGRIVVFSEPDQLFLVPIVTIPDKPDGIYQILTVIMLSQHEARRGPVPIDALSAAYFAATGDDADIRFLDDYNFHRPKCARSRFELHVRYRNQQGYKRQLYAGPIAQGWSNAYLSAPDSLLHVDGFLPWLAATLRSRNSEAGALEALFVTVDGTRVADLTPDLQTMLRSASNDTMKNGPTPEPAQLSDPALSGAAHGSQGAALFIDYQHEPGYIVRIPVSKHVSKDWRRAIRTDPLRLVELPDFLGRLVMIADAKGLQVSKIVAVVAKPPGAPAIDLSKAIAVRLNLERESVTKFAEVDKGLSDGRTVVNHDLPAKAATSASTYEWQFSRLLQGKCKDEKSSAANDAEKSHAFVWGFSTLLNG